MNLLTYFDSAASTPLHPRVKQVMIDNLDLEGNNNSHHAAGFKAQKLIDESLKTIAQVLGCNWEQLSVTYSGTDAVRRVIWESQKRWGKDSVWGSAVEHSSVSDDLVSGNVFDPMSLKGLPTDAKLAALMAANSETGQIYEAQTLRERFPQTLILRDYSQSFAKGESPDFKSCDAGVFTPQKFYGPKHIGILYLKNPEAWPEISKDSHTKSPYLVAATAEAFLLWAENQAAKKAQLAAWEKQIRNHIQTQLTDFKFHAEDVPRVTGLINVAFKGVRGSELMAVLSKEESICVSTGSACTSDIMSPTEVIKYIEPDPMWQYPVRISLHQFLTDEAVTDFCEILTHYVTQLRR
jgi:cysteine desulfurase